MKGSRDLSFPDPRLVQLPLVLNWVELGFALGLVVAKFEVCRFGVGQDLGGLESAKYTIGCMY